MQIKQQLKYIISLARCCRGLCGCCCCCCCCWPWQPVISRRRCLPFAFISGFLAFWLFWLSGSLSPSTIPHLPFPFPFPFPSLFIFFIFLFPLVFGIFSCRRKFLSFQIQVKTLAETLKSMAKSCFWPTLVAAFWRWPFDLPTKSPDSGQAAVLVSLHVLFCCCFL